MIIFELNDMISDTSVQIPKPHNLLNTNNFHQLIFHTVHVALRSKIFKIHSVKFLVNQVIVCQIIVARFFCSCRKTKSGFNDTVPS